MGAANEERIEQIKVARHYVPETLGKEMAGYSGTPLAQKLGIKAGDKVVTIGAPAGYSKLLAPLPEAVSFTQDATADASFVHLFVSERKTLEKELKRLRKLIADTGILWVSWPKQIFRRRDRYYGRHRPRGRPAARPRGRESVRRGRDMVRIETDGPARKSALTRR